LIIRVFVMLRDGGACPLAIRRFNTGRMGEHQLPTERTSSVAPLITQLGYRETEVPLMFELIQLLRRESCRIDQRDGNYVEDILGTLPGENLLVDSVKVNRVEYLQGRL